MSAAFLMTAEEKQMKEIKFETYRIEIFGKETKMRCPVIWLNGAEGEGREVWEMTDRSCVLICVSGLDWNRDLSPWKAEKIFARGEDFAGGAERYLKILTEIMMPRAERELSFAPRPAQRGIAGYSMAGLFACYAMYHTDQFGGIASISGSLWFDGWAEYALKSAVMPLKPKIYVSLGDKEHKTKNSRMRSVRRCTEDLCRCWERQGTVIYEENRGGHFENCSGRTARGIIKLTQLLQE